MGRVSDGLKHFDNIFEPLNPHRIRILVIFIFQFPLLLKAMLVGFLAFGAKVISVEKKISNCETQNEVFLPEKKEY